ncbi:CSEP0341 putative effector protein [Blumeria hordei DH14]|uniref:CSEP0341 putative effector protein n=1 Tax=Blumeria graminis f. sp. hordei (strain DH14) TaxID=546991 RepID=A0A078MYP1_BLUG1|nr:CSEP0341 putative effector protein [Blumeria hordei DH14]
MIMKSLHQVSRGLSLWLMVGFLVLEISAHASLLQRRMNLSTEPGYHCNKKIILEKTVEESLRAACRGFLIVRDTARRPLVFIEAEEDENLIYEWALPIVLENHPNYKGKKSTGKITFNNRCELISVLCYERTTKQFNISQKFPGDSTDTTSKEKQVTTKPFLQCGSLSWEIEDIQKSARKELSRSRLKFFEITSTSNRVDGPWERAFLTKKTGEYHGWLNVRYEIVVNNQKEARGIVLTHHIGRKLATAKSPDRNDTDLPVFIRKPEKQTIRLVCFFQRTFPLIYPDVSKSLKRKASSEATQD